MNAALCAPSAGGARGVAVSIPHVPSATRNCLGPGIATRWRALLDPDRPHLVVLRDLGHHVHPLGDLPEHRVHPIEMRLRGVAHEKLAATRVLTGRGPREHARHIAAGDLPLDADDL